jgi:hypothetical protein
MIIPKPITSIRTVIKIKESAADLFFIFQKPRKPQFKRFGLESRIKKQNSVYKYKLKDKKMAPF